jgi:hypothetical protein
MAFKPDLLCFQFVKFSTLEYGYGEDTTTRSKRDRNGVWWYLSLYPGGDANTYDSDYTALYLCLENKKYSHIVHVKYQFYLRDKAGNVLWESEYMDHTMKPDQEYGPGHFIPRDELLDNKRNKLLTKDGTLKIWVSIQMKAPRSEFYRPPNPICKNMLALLESGEDADISFMVKGTIFKVHSVILRANAPFILNFCKKRTKTTQKGNPIIIKETTPEVFKYMLKYIYGGELPSESKMVDSGKEIIALSNKFEVIDLKMAVENALVENCAVDRMNVADYILFADAMMCPLLKEYAFSVFVANANDILPFKEAKELRESPKLMEELLSASNDQYRSDEHLGSKSISELRNLLAAKNMDVDGSKEVLVTRLEGVMTSDESMADENSSEDEEDSENESEENSDDSDEDMEDDE